MGVRGWELRTARCGPIFGVFPAGNGTACPGADCRVSVCGFWPYRSVRRKEATTDSSQGLREDFAANGPFRCGEPMLVAVFRFAASFPRQSAFRFFVVLLLRPGESLLKAAMPAEVPAGQENGYSPFPFRTIEGRDGLGPERRLPHAVGQDAVFVAETFCRPTWAVQENGDRFVRSEEGASELVERGN